MKMIAPALLLAVLMLAANGPSESRADPYRWCAIYGGGDGYEATNCGFVTLKQCRETISGIGGMCEPNPRYTGPAEPPAKRDKKSKNN
jgi:hypothetical protein